MLAVSVSHPTTTLALAHKAIQLLRRLIDHRPDPWVLPVQLLTIHNFVAELRKLGLKRTLFSETSQEDDLDGMDVDNAAEEDAIEDEAEGEVVAIDARNAALRRWCTVLLACLNAKYVWPTHVLSHSS